MFFNEKNQKEGEELKAQHEANSMFVKMLADIMPEGDRKDEFKLLQLSQGLTSKKHTIMQEILERKDAPETKRIRDEALLLFTSINERLEGFIESNLKPQTDQKKTN